MSNSRSPSQLCSRGQDISDDAPPVDEPSLLSYVQEVAAGVLPLRRIERRLQDDGNCLRPQRAAGSLPPARMCQGLILPFACFLLQLMGRARRQGREYRNAQPRLSVDVMIGSKPQQDSNLRSAQPIRRLAKSGTSKPVETLLQSTARSDWVSMFSSPGFRTPDFRSVRFCAMNTRLSRSACVEQETKEVVAKT